MTQRYTDTGQRFQSDTHPITDRKNVSVDGVASFFYGMAKLMQMVGTQIEQQGRLPEHKVKQLDDGTIEGEWR